MDTRSALILGVAIVGGLALHAAIARPSVPASDPSAVEMNRLRTEADVSIARVKADAEKSMKLYESSIAQSVKVGEQNFLVIRSFKMKDGDVDITDKIYDWRDGKFVLTRLEDASLSK